MMGIELRGRSSLGRLEEEESGRDSLETECGWGGRGEVSRGFGAMAYLI